MVIAKYLTKGETIDKTYFLKGCDVYATNKRLFVWWHNSKTVQDYDYRHISSLAFGLKNYLWLAGIGAIILIGAPGIFFLSQQSGGSPFDILGALIGMVAGIVLIVAGLIIKKEYLQIFVIGVTDKVAFQGERSNLDELFKTIREKKESAKSPSDSGDSTATEKTAT